MPTVQQSTNAPARTTQRATIVSCMVLNSVMQVSDGVMHVTGGVVHVFSGVMHKGNRRLASHVPAGTAKGTTPR